MYGWTTSTPVSSSATVTPAPENPGIGEAGAPPAGYVVVHAARVDRGGNRGSHREDASHIGIADDDGEARASSGVANPLNTR